MPAVLSYPGVSIEEAQSEVHTITGVATPITAFVGRAARGPIDSDPNSAVRIFSFADYHAFSAACGPTDRRWLVPLGLAQYGVCTLKHVSSKASPKKPWERDDISCAR